MGPNSVTYGFVARGPVVLVGRAPASIQQEFQPIANGCLERLSAENTGDGKMGYRVDDHDFLFLMKGGYIYSVLVHNQDPNFAIKQEKLLLFLNHVEAEFSQRFGAGEGGVADTAPEYGLEEAFGPHLRKLIAAFHVENPTPTVVDDKKLLQANKAQAKEVESVMAKNMERFMSQTEEFEKIDIVVEKPVHNETQNLDAGSERAPQKVRWWRSHIKSILIVLAILIAIFLIIFYASCDGIKCVQ